MGLGSGGWVGPLFFHWKTREKGKGVGEGGGGGRDRQRNRQVSGKSMRKLCRKQLFSKLPFSFSPTVLLYLKGARMQCFFSKKAYGSPYRAPNRAPNRAPHRSPYRVFSVKSFQTIFKSPIKGCQHVSHVLCSAMPLLQYPPDIGSASKGPLFSSGLGLDASHSPHVLKKSSGNDLGAQSAWECSEYVTLIVLKVFIYRS